MVAPYRVRPAAPTLALLFPSPYVKSIMAHETLLILLENITKQIGPHDKTTIPHESPRCPKCYDDKNILDRVMSSHDHIFSWSDSSQLPDFTPSPQATNLLLFYGTTSVQFKLHPFVLVSVPRVIMHDLLWNQATLLWKLFLRTMDIVQWTGLVIFSIRRSRSSGP